MNYEKMTIKVQEYLNDAMNTARERKSPEINELHFIYNVIKDENIITSLIKKAGIELSIVSAKVETELSKLAKVNSGAVQLYLSSGFNDILEASFKLAKDMGDEYLSLEHILLALLKEKKGVLFRIFSELELDHDTILKLLKSIRGNQQIKDADPEDIEILQRKLIQLEIEKQAVSKEKDKKSAERFENIKKEIANLKSQADELKVHWEQEKEFIKLIREGTKKLDSLKNEESAAERNGELEKVSKLRYQEIPSVKKKLDEASAKLESFQSGRKMLKEEIGENEIAEIISRWTHIPVNKLLESEKDKLLKMEELLGMRVKGQDEALRVVAEALRRNRAGLQDPNRPIASFIFLGSTGVGKTELAKALAEFMFDSDSAMVRIDMSEYMESFSVTRLIGPPPGYVGYDEGGQLTDAVRKKPFSIVLFDEIEKAHPQVFNILLQVLDDGRLTDNKGRTVNFRNTIIIMTSNLGSDMFTGIEEVTEDKKQELISMVKKVLKPEFVNRIDDIIVFNKLSRDVILQITDRLLADINKRLADRDIMIITDKESQKYLTEKGYDPVFGARPLKRLIEKTVLNNLSVKLLSGEINAGDKIKLSTLL